MTWVYGFLAIAPLVLSACANFSSVTPKASVSPTPPPTSINPSPIPTATPLPTQAASRLEASDADLWSQLRQGRGYVILFRHAVAPGTGDPADFRLDDCSTQRNLSAEGRQQAVEIGEVLRQQNIPVSRVLSSQWCRCLETARLMNVGQVEPFSALNSFFQDRGTERSQTEQLRQFILQNRDNAEVTIMVTHQVNITAISTIVPRPGSAVVMRASSPNQVEFVGQLDSLTMPHSD